VLKLIVALIVVILFTAMLFVYMDKRIQLLEGELTYIYNTINSIQ
jgi:hypothetical protein